MTHSQITLKNVKIAHHRNGIFGAPFHVITFIHDNDEMIAAVFEAPYHIAVFNLQKLASGEIAFGSNSYRGDCYETALREAIAEFINAS